MRRPRVLIFGDSNSWGFPVDGSGIRMTDRWPLVMARSVEVDLIEEALPGRTIARDDPEMLGAAMNGRLSLIVALNSHQPIDLVLIMLGTNDLKSRFNHDVESVVGDLVGLVRTVHEHGGRAPVWEGREAPAVGILLPPGLGARVDDSAWERYVEWRGATDIRNQLGPRAKAALEAAGAAVFDTAEVATGNSADPIHLDDETHAMLGQAIAAWLPDAFAELFGD